MTTNTNYTEHISIMKDFQMADSFYEVRAPFKESFEEIYAQAQEENVSISNAKEFLNSLSKEELSTLQNYTLLVNDIDVDSLSDEGAYNLLLHHYEKYDFNNDGVRENGEAQTKALIPQSLDSDTKRALVETFNTMEFGDVMMASLALSPLTIQVVDGEIKERYQNYTYEDIVKNIETFLDPRNSSNSSAEFTSTIGNFLEHLTQNYNKIKENEAILASYTKTNTTTPTNTTTNTDEKRQALVDDLISVIKTGFTEAELENIEKLLAEIRKLMQEKNDENSTTSHKDIDEQIKAIEDALLALEKRLYGVSIVEMDDENTKKENQDQDTQKSTGFNFEERIDAITKRVDILKNGDFKEEPLDTYMREKEELEEDKIW